MVKFEQLLVFIESRSLLCGGLIEVFTCYLMRGLSVPLTMVHCYVFKSVANLIRLV